MHVGPKHISGTMRTPFTLIPRGHPTDCLQGRGSLHSVMGDSVSVTEVGLLKSSFCVSLSLASESVSCSGVSNFS